MMRNRSWLAGLASKIFPRRFAAARRASRRRPTHSLRSFSDAPLATETLEPRHLLSGVSLVSVDTLAITDVNEAPTGVALANTVSSLAEDTNTAVKVGDIQISDDALGSNAISLSGTDAASFTVVGTELFLAAGTSLDYESQNSYDVTVSVQDSSVAGSPPVTVNYMLAITDVNEPPEQLTLSNTVSSIVDNVDTSTPIKVADVSFADDALGQNIISLTGADAASFEIIGNELFLAADTVLDSETKPGFDVTLRVSDSTAGPPGSFVSDWTHQYGSANTDWVRGVGADASGNVYAFGETRETAFNGVDPVGSTDFYISKFDSTGAEQWTIVEGSAAPDSVTGRMVVDSSGNCYVAGETLGSLFDSKGAGAADGWLGKYDSDGNLAWGQQINSGGWDTPKNVSIDNAGNLYLVGHTTGSLDGTAAGSADVFVRKYDTDGNLIWGTQFGSDKADRGYDVTANSAGEVYVVGSTSGDLAGISNPGAPNKSGGFLTKLSGEGNLLWTEIIASDAKDQLYGVAVDSLGSVVLVGETLGNINGQAGLGAQDLIVAKYDANGDEVWTRYISGSGADHGYDVAIDAADDIIVSGKTTSSDGDLDSTTSYGKYDAILARFDADGELLRIDRFGGPDSDLLSPLHLSEDGTLLAGGNTRGAWFAPNAYGADGVHYDSVLMQFQESLPESSTIDYRLNVLPVEVLIDTLQSGSETDGSPTVFTLTRTGDTSSPLDVNLILQGTAQPNVDYTAPAGLGTSRSFAGSGAEGGEDTGGGWEEEEPDNILTVTFAAGSNTATLSLPTLSDSVVDSYENILAILQPGSDYYIKPGADRADAFLAADGLGALIDNSKSIGRYGFRSLSNGYFAALDASGVISVWGPDSAHDLVTQRPTIPGFVEIVSNNFAFSAIHADGSVQSWGSATQGGSHITAYGNSHTPIADVSDLLTQHVVRVVPAAESFTAIKSDGTSVFWGYYGNYFINTLVDRPENVTQVATTWGWAVAALSADGSITAWGQGMDGGGVPGWPGYEVPTGTGYTALAANHWAFAALHENTSISCWGGGPWDWPYNASVDDAPTDAGYVSVVGNESQTQSAFTAIKANGSISSWGGVVQEPYGSGFTRIIAAETAFTAINGDGSLYSWGGAGDAPAGNEFTQVFNTTDAFAAIRRDGSVSAWGDAAKGGDTSSVDHLLYDVVTIAGNRQAFAALKADGTVVTWGAASHGGDSSSVADQLTGVTAIMKIDDAFTARREDGSLVSWGNSGNLVPPPTAGIYPGFVNIDTVDQLTFDSFLSLTPNLISEGVGAGAATGTVTRTGDLSGDLIVNLASSDISEATVPATVTIPAGQASASFPINAVNDDTADLIQPVYITASVAGQYYGRVLLKVADDGDGSLFIDDGDAGYSISGGSTVTISDQGYEDDYQWTLGVSQSSPSYIEYEVTNIAPGDYEIATTWQPEPEVAQFVRHPAVKYEIYDGPTLLDTVLVNQQQAPLADYTDGGENFEIIAPSVSINSDTLFVRILVQSLEAGYSGYRTLSADAVRIESLNSIDPGDPLSLSLSTADASITEGGAGTLATLSRTGLLDQTLAVSILNSHPTEAVTPDYVVIPAGESQVTFVVEAVDDSFGDGNQTITLSANALGAADIATIEVIDDDINIPPILNDQSIDVLEHASVGSVIGFLVAYDANNDPLTFSILQNVDQNNDGTAAFMLSSDGYLSVLDRYDLDYELTSNLEIEVEVIDAAFADTATITINIIPVDFAPEIDDQVFAVTKGSAAGTVIGDLVAEDLNNDTLIYTIETNVDPDGDGTPAFGLEPISGQLLVNDRDDITGYYLAGFPELDGWYLELGNGNTAPLDDPDHYRANWIESTDQRRVIQFEDWEDWDYDSELVVERLDSGNVLLHYEFIGNGTNQSHALHGVTSDGADFYAYLGTNAPFDTTIPHARLESLAIDVLAFDGALSDSATVTITLAGNSPPLFQDQTLSVAENSAAQTLIGTLAAVDDDVSNPIYTIIQNAADLDNDGDSPFLIDGDQLLVNDLDDLDYEADSQLVVIVEASDGSLTDTAEITVNVTNVNEVPVITLVGDAYEVVAFSQSGDYVDPGAMAMDPEDGDLTSSIDVSGDSVDLSSVGTYVIDYNVQDASGIAAETVSRTVVVESEPPVIDDQAFYVAENATEGTLVGTLVAADPDESSTSTAVVDNLDDGYSQTASSFTVDGQGYGGSYNWTLSVYETPKYMQFEKTGIPTGRYQIATTWQTESENAGYPRHHAVAYEIHDGTTLIETVYVDQTAPPSADWIKNGIPFEIILPEVDIQSDALSVRIVVDSSLGYRTVSADAIHIRGENLISYEIVTNVDADGDGTDAFALSGTSILVADSDDLDYEGANPLAIEVEVSDGESTDSATVTINLTDVNEAPTDISLYNLVETLPENADTTVPIRLADIQVTDDAIGTTTFSVSGSLGTIFEVTGESLYTKAGLNLDYEGGWSTYSMTVVAQDESLAGSQPLTASYVLQITDVNEAPTGVTLQNAVSSLPEDTDTSSAVKVGDIQISDDALGTNVISLSGADAASFTVVGTELFLAAGTVLDYETKSSYDVTVSVADSSVAGSTPLTVDYSLLIDDVAGIVSIATTQQGSKTNGPSNRNLGFNRFSGLDQEGDGGGGSDGTDGGDDGEGDEDDSGDGEDPGSATLQPTIFTLTRTGDTSSPLDVSLILQGTAQPDWDYDAPAGLGVNNTLTVSFAAGSDTVTVSLPTEPDWELVDSYQSVVAILRQGLGYTIMPGSDRTVAYLTADGVDVADDRHAPFDGPNSTHRLLRNGNFAVLDANGSISVGGPDSDSDSSLRQDVPEAAGYQQLYSNANAFCALHSDGSVSAWGHSSFGGSLGSVAGSLTEGVVSIVPSRSSFTAFKADGSVVMWGNPTGGQFANYVYPPNEIFGVKKVATTYAATAVLTAGGDIYAWGNPVEGGGAAGDGHRHNSPADSGYTDIVGGWATFAALRADGSIRTWGGGPEQPWWGDPEIGSVTKTPVDSGYTHIVANGATATSFAAMKADGSITTWGMINHNPPGSGFTQIVPSENAFTAIRTDGSLYSWNADGALADTPTVSDITQVVANANAFAAIREDGSVVTWGDSASGGDSDSVSEELFDVVKIASTDLGFAALRRDGSVVPWGDQYHGGSWGVVGGNITDIFATDNAFAARSGNGSLAIWGYDTATYSESDAYGFVAHVDPLLNDRLILDSFFDSGPFLIDDGDPGYSSNLSPITITGQGYESDYRWILGTTPDAPYHIQYVMTGVTAGDYQIATTWQTESEIGSFQRHEAVKYEIYDGLTLVDMVTVNQRLAPAADYTESGENFQLIASGVSIDSGSLNVKILVQSPGEGYSNYRTISADAVLVMADYGDPPVMEDQTFSVAENSSEGTVIGTLAATDADGDAITYSIISNVDPDADGSDAVRVEGDQLLVNDADDLDYETNPQLVITAKASDGNGFNTAMITVNLIDVEEIPVITILGDSPYTVQPSNTTSYSDPGATASDDEDGDLTGSILVSGDVVDLGVPGSYLIEYDVADSAGNDAETVTRTVLVQDTLPPVITLTGEAAVSVTFDPSGTYSDVGATAVDSLDGDLTGSIVIGGDVVDLAQDGTYTLTYNVSDNAGNAAEQVIRTVQVVTCDYGDAPATYPVTLAEDGARHGVAGGNVEWETLGQGISVETESFGLPVAISGGGNTLAVGNVTTGTQVYRWDGSAWIQLGSNVAGAPAGSNIFYSVSLSDDGNTVAVGDPYQAGSVRIYSWDGSAWNQLGSNIEGEGVDYRLGGSVSLSSDGQTVAIGGDLGLVRIYHLDGAEWYKRGDDINVQVNYYYASVAVSLSGDGNAVAIGSPESGTAGVSQIYQWNGTAWNQLGTDIDGEASGDQSGGSVSLSSDGHTVAIGAHYNDGDSGQWSSRGHTRIFTWDGIDWVQRGSDIDGDDTWGYSGSSVALSDDGETVAIAALWGDGGGTRIYRWLDNQWQQAGDQLQTGDYGGDDYHGSIALSADGSRVVVGPFSSDLVRVFDAQVEPLRLGSSIDDEPDGVHSPGADADGADEDGVVFGDLIAGDTASVDVTVSGASGFLDAWLDLNANGDWSDAGEQIFVSEAVSVGVNNLSFAVPVDATIGTTFARFRLSSTGGLGVTGLATDGEVEDYAVTISTNEGPVFSDQSFSIDENSAGGTLIGTLAATDADGDAITYSITTNADPDSDGNAAFRIEGDGLLVNDPDDFNYETNPQLVITAEASDGSLTDTAQITVNVTDVNENPVAMDDAHQVLANAELTVGAAGVLGNDTDADGDALTAVLVSSTSNGILSFNADGSFTYTSDANFAGDDTFTYQVSDGTNLSNVATVTISVIPYVTFENPTNSDYADFGWSTAIDGDRVLIGTPRGVAFGTEIGKAHLFDLQGNLLQTFDDPVLTTEDWFGASVAISGDYVLISDSGDDTAGTNIGQAHLFDAATGNLLHTFSDPTPTTEDHFGAFVAIEGGQILIGDYRDDTAAENSGQVHLFDAASRSLLRTIQNPNTTTPSNNRFGSAGDISDGRILVGATNDGIGRAHLFDASDGSLLHSFDDPTADNKDYFASSVALDGNYIVIGAFEDDSLLPSAGQAYVFDATTGLLLHTLDNPEPNNMEWFGEAVAIDGSRIVVGAMLNRVDGQQIGEAYLFDAVSGDLVRTFAEPSPSGFDSFGHDVAVDGDHVLIGAYMNRNTELDIITGEAYLYHLSGDTPPVFDNQSFSVAENSADGTVVGTLAATDFDGDSLAYSIVTNIDLDGDGNGAFRIEGDQLLVNDRGDLDYEYQSQLQITASASDGTTADTAVITIDITNVIEPPVAADDAYPVMLDGSLTVDAPGVLANDTVIEGDALTAIFIDEVQHGTLQGSADGSFTYQPDPGFEGIDTFTYRVNDGFSNSDNVATVTLSVSGLLHTLDNPTDNITPYGSFGNAVAVDGNYVLVGAPLNKLEGSNYFNGEVYLFEATTGSLLHSFAPPESADGRYDDYGYSVDIEGNLIAIGAPDVRRYSPPDIYSGPGMVYLYDAATGDLLRTIEDPTPSQHGEFGNSVALDGNQILIGNPGDDTNGQDAGQAYLFNVTTGSLLHTLDAPTPASRDEFGEAVAIDDGKILVSAPYDDTLEWDGGQVYLFDAATGNLIHTLDDPTPRIQGYFGKSLAVHASHILVGNAYATGGGKAHQFDAITGQLVRTINSPTSYASFGWSVAIQDDIFVIGATDAHQYGKNTGQVYLYNAVSGDRIRWIDDPTVTTRDSFGYSVAIDGEYVVIGAADDDTLDTDVGQAHIYRYDFGQPPPVFDDQTFSLAENSAVGTAIGTLAATDADGDAITYSIISNVDPDGDGNDAFRIEGDQLLVNDADDLDYEADPQLVITAQASDGSLTDTAQITVNVTDVDEIPIITLVGDSPYAIEASSTGDYSDPGATAADPEDGDLTGSVSVSGQVVNLSVPGSYLINYDVADSTGNDAETVTRTVIVQDTLAPVITLTGDAVVNLTVDPGGTYSDAGATALDALDGDLTGSIVASGDVVDLAQAGTYTLTYNVSDNAGNAAEQVTRTVNVLPAAVGEVTILDDGEAGFAENGFTEQSNAQVAAAYDGDVHHMQGGTGEASWTFTGLPADRYQVAATWAYKYNNNYNATDAPFTLSDGAGGVFSTHVVNQRIAPAEFEDGGYFWNTLDTVEVSGGTLVVTLGAGSLSNKWVVADAIRVSVAATLTLSINDASVAESAGTAATTATVTRNGPTDYPVDVDLLVSDATEISVPTSVTIPAGQASASFSIDAVDDVFFDGTQSVNVLATAIGYSDGSDSLEILDDETAHTALIDDGEAGFAQSGFTYQNNAQVAAAYNGDNYNLRNGDDADQASWTFTGLDDGAYHVMATWAHKYNNNYNATDAPFAIQDIGGNVLSSVAINQKNAPSQHDVGGTFWDTLDTVYVAGGELTVTVGATAQANKFVVADAVRIEQLVQPSSTLVVQLGEEIVDEDAGSVSGIVSRGAETVGDLVITLNSDDAAVGTVPATVTIPDGVGAVPFTLTVVDDAIVDGDQNVLITASAAGYSGGTDSLLVEDDEFPPVQIIDNGDAGFTETGGFKARSWAEAYDGDNHYMRGSDGEARWQFTDLIDGEYTVSITWDHISDNRYNATDAPFTIRNAFDEQLLAAAVDQTLSPADFSDGVTDWHTLGTVYVIDGELTVSLTEALVNKYVVADAVRLEIDTNPTSKLLVILDASSVSEAGTLNGKVIRTGDTAGSLTVNLASDNAAAATVPASITLGEGARYGTFAITPTDDSAPDGTQVAGIAATAAGFTAGTAALDVTDDDATILFVDNGEDGFVADAGFKRRNVAGAYQNDNHSMRGGTGEASWTFTGLEEGQYFVSATWNHIYENRYNTEKAPFSITNGSGNLLATTIVDQTQTPADFTDGGYGWEALAPVYINDGTLIVTLGASPTNHHAVADAIRIELNESLAPSLFVLVDTLSESAGASTGTVVRTGDVSSEATVGLTSSNPDAATVESSITFAIGESTKSFAVTPTDDSSPDGIQQSTIEATAASYAAGSAVLNVEDDDALEVAIMDNTDNGYTSNGFRYNANKQVSDAYGGNNESLKGGEPGEEASWTFTGLTDGVYHVSATWNHQYNNNYNATDAQYSITNAGDEALATTTINQSNAPSEFLDSGIAWGTLETVTVTGGELIVTVSGGSNPNRHTVADAVRIARVAELGGSSMRMAEVDPFYDPLEDSLNDLASEWSGASEEEDQLVWGE